MSRRIVAVLAVVFALVRGATGFVGLHAGGQNKAVVHFPPDPPAAHASVTSEPPPTRGAKNEAAASGVAKGATSEAAPEPGFMPAAGEVLEFSGSVAKVNNVASLRLVVTGRKEIDGADAWHLQAFAHTQNPLRMVFELDDQFDSYSAPR